MVMDFHHKLAKQNIKLKNDVKYYRRNKNSSNNLITLHCCYFTDYFHIVLKIHGLKFLVNNQPDALFHEFIYSFHLSTHFEHQVFIIRRLNCINTSSGMISPCKWLLGMPVRNSLLTGIPSSHLHRQIIPDDVLIQFDLLMMSTMMLETCREV